MRVYANEMYGDWLLLRRPQLRGRLAFDIRFELMSKKELQDSFKLRFDDAGRAHGSGGLLGQQQQ